MKLGTAGFIVFCTLLFGCDSSPPELQQLYWQLNVISNAETGAVYESLSLWVQANDEDGTEDIEFIYIINDNEELLWELSAEAWDEVTQPGETWFGTNDATSADQSDLPRGEYRIVLVDSAGDRDERSFYLSTQKNILQSIPLPLVTEQNDKFTVENTPYGFALWGYTGEGDFIQSVKNLDAEFSPEEISTEIPNLAFFYIYTYDLNQGFGIVSGPFRIDEE